MCSGMHTNEHTALPSRVGQDMSMLALTCSLPKTALVPAVPWEMGPRAMAISH